MRHPGSCVGEHPQMYDLSTELPSRRQTYPLPRGPLPRDMFASWRAINQLKWSWGSSNPKWPITWVRSTWRSPYGVKNCSHYQPFFTSAGRLKIQELLIIDHWSSSSWSSSWFFPHASKFNIFKLVIIIFPLVFFVLFLSFLPPTPKNDFERRRFEMAFIRLPQIATPNSAWRKLLHGNLRATRQMPP